MPNLLIIRSYLTRGLTLWIVVRGAISLVLLLAGANVFRLSVLVMVEIVLVVAALGWIETMRRRERVLLENLGVSPVFIVLFFAGPAVAGELVMLIGATVTT